MLGIYIWEFNDLSLSFNVVIVYRFILVKLILFL